MAVRSLLMLAAAAAAALAGDASVGIWPFTPGGDLTPDEIRAYLASFGVTVTAAEMDIVTRCVLNQSNAQAAASSLKLAQWHVGPSSTPGKYGMGLLKDMVSPILGLPDAPMKLGAHPNLGSYDACEISHGRFCYAFLVDPFLSWEAMLTSACVPQECTAADLQFLGDAVLKNPLLPAQVTAFTNGKDFQVECAGTNPTYEEDDGAKNWTAVLVTLFAIIALCTFVTRLNVLIPLITKAASEEERATLMPDGKDPKKGAQPQGLLPKGLAGWVECCDLAKSWEVLMQISPPARCTNFLNGMRVFSISWVILGHVGFFMSTNIPGFDNAYSGAIVPVVGTYRSIFIPSTLYAVDTFFFMSGFLACYLFMGSKAKNAWDASFNLCQTVRNLLLTWLARFVRLTPLYAIVLFSNYYLLEHMMDGPYSTHYRHGGHLGGEKCAKYWMFNLLYIQNLFTENDVDKQFCFGHSWYLAVDTQFLILGSILMVGYIYAPKASLAVTAALGVMSLVFVADYVTKPIEFFNMGMYNYNKPYIRPMPYLMGMVCGWAVAEHMEAVKRITASWKVRLACYLTSAALMVGCMTLAWAAMRQQDLPEYAWTVWEARLYQLAYHTFWGMGLSMLTMCWVAGHGGAVKGFLSHPIFEPMGRVTFGVYLIHPMVQLILGVGLNQGPAIHYTDLWYMVMFVSSWVGAYLAGTICFLFIERPTGSLYGYALKAAMGGGRKKKEVPEGQQRAAEKAEKVELP
eukprot:TRINITY_DN24542_c0_g1_i1.p1 TRINITY_DN24542_c0_g1~~TRINITY_DN24542_c0_g1_i1.p1  ORF type:complete len:742 (+),score=293.26 TRINITY_DN24542_c0_g1_i1:48-2273(+)